MQFRVMSGPALPPDPKVIDRLADRIIAAIDECHGMDATLALGAALARVCSTLAEGNRDDTRTLAVTALEAGLGYEQADSEIQR